MSNLRILLADDHEVVRKGLSSLLQSHGWEICGEVSDGRQAVEKTQQLKPDLVILDIGMPNLNGLDATRQILHTNPQQKILILTITDTDQVVRDVLLAIWWLPWKQSSSTVLSLPPASEKWFWTAT
jgi:DNA-binding NarL/FixJ family response regulator